MKINTFITFKVLGIILLTMCITLLFMTAAHFVQPQAASIGWAELASIGWNGIVIST